MTLYAIGDIHGHLDKLKLAHDRISIDRAACGARTAPIVHVGDLVDRGPDSAGVVDYLCRLQKSDPSIVVLKGNHDRMFHWFLQTPHRNDPKLRAGLTYLGGPIGGLTTLASYGVDISAPPAEMHRSACAVVPEAHRAFLAALPLVYQAGACLFVHAGIRPGIALEDQSEDDMVWIRDDFLHDTTPHGPLVVHGHSTVKQVEHHGNRLNIDTGAAFGGLLSAVVIEDRQVWLLGPDGRVPVKPHA
ncbi:serine/threonine protein phosphatase [Rhodophyticola sp. CCM32]|uniref:metallophosphoesterase n=1 Tax=Rhodophyticola sp. CCM32 TaxID=2916397 RepID=UPI00107F9898|nr:metallophosphoesterase [Rhodophyticola sp. CCM32]QBY01466.1 serine/threonine protein phosphatase [Rhodophyticola sp. CCM32]